MTNKSSPIPPEMRAIEIEKPGGPEVLKVVRRATPQPGDKEVLIRVVAAGVNRPEVLQRLGLYPAPPGATDIPGLEAAGVIASVGAGVTKWKAGDTICALLPGGGYAEYALTHEGSCLPAPRSIKLEEAAALPETVFTVWANVFDDAALKPGESLLVHGGTSGIGVTAISMAKAWGARVIATAGTAEKIAACKKTGADAAYNYKDYPWDDEIARSGGVDVVLDMAGGDFVARNMACLKPGGRHVSIAFLRGNEAVIDIFPIMKNRLRLSGSTMKARSPSEKARLADGLRENIWPLIESGKIRPVIDRYFPLEEAAKAHAHMESGAHIGKIVLKVR